MEDKAKSQSAKIQDILAKLNKVEEKKNLFKQNYNETNIANNNEEKQTVSDDFDVNKAKEKKILHYEDIIRKALAMFNLSYDDLIRMDGKSAYNKAVEFYPHLIDEVKKSNCPPLTALHIAKSMQPYLEFTNKYGSSLEEIKQSLKEEINQEKKSKNQIEKTTVNKTPANPVQQASMFSDIGNAITQNEGVKSKEKSDESLASFFYR